MNTLKYEIHHKPFQNLIMSLVLLGVIAGCAKNPSSSTTTTDNSSNSATSTPPTTGTGTGTGTDTPVTTPTPPAATYKAEPLIWESSSHPERAQWSSALMGIVANSFAQLDQAKDTASFCPRYASLTQDQKINVWADIFAGTAYYECAWDPTSNSVDVGTSNNRDTWSVGLLQLSVVDQQNYGFQFGFNFSDLEDPIKNLQLGVAIMAKQVTKRGVIMIPVGGSGLYWATLHPGGRYDASAGIIKMVKKLSFCQ